MVVIKDDNFLIKAKIEIGNFFGVEKPEAFVELREPTTKDLIALKNAASTKDEDIVLTVFGEVLPRIIVAHSFYKSETEKMGSQEVATLIVDRLEVYAEVLGAYLSIVFPQAMPSAAKSDGSPE